MKTLEELMALRDAAKANLTARDDSTELTRVVVGMATCGIAAGARPVMNKFVEETAKRNLTNVTVAQTGCIGMCQYEPIAEVMVPGKEKVTYVQLTEEKVARIVVDHLVNGNPVAEYTVGAIAK
ncbi:MAG: (2Fe-2S) ferredoxin domain-containing protein [Ruminococcaceae bacterium]|nr:(2Fe-2S) ferredoxin domain-containing protein [Oscillospiraceae bacterium]MBQ9913425.1 (2Fe-2S) ferredoxin domain-containing protein [Clostridia bacterium]